MSLPSPARVRTVLLALALACAVVVALLAPAGASAATPALVLRQPGVNGPFGNELLSNERTVTRHARARYESPIYRFPTSSAVHLGKLRFMTEDGFPEVYVVLESRRDVSDQVWLKIRIPGRPNGRVGWVRDSKLGALQNVDTFLHIRRGRDARLYRGERVIWQAPVGTGAATTPTPAGHFWIREKFRGTGGIYGPWVFGTAAYSVLSEWPRGGVIGIHGTDQPGLLPGRPSHGCIRVRNAQITQLYRLMPVGTPLLIS
ncbi:MAG: ErfK/YbiS/YcfS/YnhG family protein [Thermoleophilia bacterium]|nr:ErfK/YbiS/YcfS/YnhG family protein [Thermoleophilia bacterium]